MKRKDLDYLVIALLILGSLYLLISGIIMDLSGIHRFVGHAAVGYSWVGLAVIHLSFSAKRVVVYWKNRLRGIRNSEFGIRNSEGEGSGFGVRGGEGSGFGVRDSGLKNSEGEGSGFGVRGSELKNSEGEGSGFGVRGSELKNSEGEGSGFGVRGSELKNSEVGVWKSDVESRRREVGTKGSGWSIALLSRRWWLLGMATIVGTVVMGRLLGREGTIEADALDADLGRVYQRWSEIGSPRLLAAQPDWGSQPPLYKTYPDLPSFALPDPTGGSGMTVAESIATRRSTRNYQNQALALGDLSRLLYAAQGITDSRWGLRTVPSSGALYPLEVYVIAHQVTDLGPGIYHYGVQAHQLEQLQAGEMGSAIVSAGIGQDFLAEAGVCLVISGLFQRARWKYRERTYRYVLIEVGHLGQNLYLMAQALGLGACTIGAFRDEAVNALLGLDGVEEAALYLVTIGQPAR
jgi:SagB-type dehydrogenase family enzyme